MCCGAVPARACGTDVGDGRELAEWWEATTTSCQQVESIKGAIVMSASTARVHEDMSDEERAEWEYWKSADGPARPEGHAAPGARRVASLSRCRRAASDKGHGVKPAEDA